MLCFETGVGCCSTSGSTKQRRRIQNSSHEAPEREDSKGYLLRQLQAPIRHSRSGREVHEPGIKEYFQNPIKECPWLLLLLFMCLGAGIGEVHHTYSAVFWDQQGIRLHAERGVDSMHYSNGWVIDYDSTTCWRRGNKIMTLFSFLLFLLESLLWVFLSCR